MPKIIYDEIVRQTNLAIQYQIDGEKVWIPISQIQWEDLGNHIVELPDWLIKANKLKVYRI